MKRQRNNHRYGADEVKRYLGVLQEHTDDRFKAIEEHFSGVNQNLGDVKTTVSSHTEMIGNLAVQLEIVKEEVHIISGGLKKKVGQEEFEALTRRVSMLEKRVLR